MYIPGKTNYVYLRQNRLFVYPNRKYLYGWGPLMSICSNKTKHWPIVSNWPTAQKNSREFGTNMILQIVLFANVKTWYYVPCVFSENVGFFLVNWRFSRINTVSNIFLLMCNFVVKKLLKVFFCHPFVNNTYLLLLL